MAKKKGGAQKSAAAAAGGEAGEERKRSEKEMFLQHELDALSTDNNQLRETLEQLRRDNHFLQEQANKSVEEATDYSMYMKGRAEEHQNDVLTVNQRNTQEMSVITEECKTLTGRFEDRMEKLTEELAAKKLLLSRATEELTSLDHVKFKETEALEKIKSLDAELEKTRAKHSQEIQLMKAEFLSEKKSIAEEANQNILQLSKKATEVAANCLNQHAERVQKENQHLRTELLALLSESDQLQQRKQDLEQQYLSLTRENEYLDDLKKMRVYWYIFVTYFFYIFYVYFGLSAWLL